jgi:hypothetical protein
LWRKNIVNKPTFLKVIRSVPLRLFLLIAVIGLGGSTYTQAAAPQAPQMREAFFPFFDYRFVAGSSLHSADYTMREDYQPGACISVVDAADQFLNVGLQLPDGVRIDYLRLFFNDINTTYDGTASIRKYDGAGGTIEITSVSSAGSAGFGTTLSAYVGHVVNNADGGYVLNWLAGTTGSSMQLCGLRIAYRLPATSTFLPLIFK